MREERRENDTVFGPPNFTSLRAESPLIDYLSLILGHISGINVSSQSKRAFTNLRSVHGTQVPTDLHHEVSLTRRNIMLLLMRRRATSLEKASRDIMVVNSYLRGQ